MTSFIIKPSLYLLLLHDHHACFYESQLSSLQYRRMDFEEFCAAAINIYQLEALDRWEQHARCAYELFEKDGNRAIMIEELASVSFLLTILQNRIISTSY